METTQSFDLEAVGANHFAITVDGRWLDGPFECGDPQTRIRVAQGFARDGGRVVNSIPPGGVGRYELASPVPVPDTVSPPGQLAVRLPGPAAAAVARVLRDTGDTPGAMIAKALGLYMMALDAKRRGKAVGAADSADALETEFTGF